VEVVLAIGVFSFCLLTLIALIPVGLTDNRTSRDRMIAADLCSSLESDLNSTSPSTNASPLNIKFPIPSTATYVSSTTVLYDSYGSASPTATFSTTRAPNSQYCFTVVVTAPPSQSYPTSPVIANIQATWPAAAVPSKANGTINTSVVINRY
jgi:uncharacterized protein (TIGR02598 family)